MISAPALLHPLPFPDGESPHIDPEETFTPQFLPASFYSQGKLQPSLTLSCSPALRRRASTVARGWVVKPSFPCTARKLWEFFIFIELLF